MKTANPDKNQSTPLQDGQLGAYLFALLAFILFMGILWVLGVESVYEHPAPFYALFLPASTDLLAQAFVFTIGIGGLTAAYFALNGAWATYPLPTIKLLAVLFLFSVTFACALAMLRGGVAGIALPYTRVQYEYVGDIGVTSGIYDLFRRYNEISPYLTLHSRAAPPGPIAILWSFTYLLGNDPLTLALCTILFGALGIIPFFLWVRELSTERIALTASLLYVCCPGIILFTATSADILFMPFTLGTLYCFERAIRRDCAKFALAAGLGFGVMAHLKFPLLGFGAYFAFVGLRYMAYPERRFIVIKCAAIMFLSFLSLIGAVWLYTGFDIVTCFQQAMFHFNMDQLKLDEITPRYPGWVYRLLNPFAWFFFAGIPVSVLFFAALFGKNAGLTANFSCKLKAKLTTIRHFFSLRPNQRSSAGEFGSLSLIFHTECLIIFLTLFVLNLLCMARGEVERSSLYMFPLIIVPAAILLDRISEHTKSLAPLFTALAFMCIQCWAVETLFYTYW